MVGLCSGFLMMITPISLVANDHSGCTNTYKTGCKFRFLQYEAILFLRFSFVFFFLSNTWHVLGMIMGRFSWAGSKQTKPGVTGVIRFNYVGNQNACTKWEHLYISRIWTARYHSEKAILRNSLLCIGCHVSSISNFCFCMNCIQSMLTIIRCLWFTSSCTIFSSRPWGGQGEHPKWHQLWATASCKLVVQFLNSIFDQVWPCQYLLNFP